MYGAAGPVPGGMNRARGQHKCALCVSHGPEVVAEPNAGEAPGIAARVLMFDPKSIAIMCGVHARNTS